MLERAVPGTRRVAWQRPLPDTEPLPHITWSGRHIWSPLACVRRGLVVQFETWFGIVPAIPTRAEPHESPGEVGGPLLCGNKKSSEGVRSRLRDHPRIPNWTAGATFSLGSAL